MVSSFENEKILKRSPMTKESRKATCLTCDMRSIGDREYTAKQRMVNGAIDGEETIETTMASEEFEDFKMEWDTKWNPSITESNGIIGSFFKIFNPFM